ncbi:TetR/AcrR family transcriptional regulator [Actinokineospora auranticolor]|uniref:Regulatory TetR family protein n=1 Tax=Actinokineospora auranticolor TaxID=155976 RepID=A0A2S6GME1_9PSEU|nr:TetR/AcrR family transcriptional regulator [Actinokineospora auranticolor]PPK66404.1 regulatory TetR family protein [Actinokineospora auranticolor]
MTAAESDPDPARLEPPWWTPRKSGARRSLSRETIVAAAVRILRAEGVDGVSMRRVAAELGTGPASLYAHVANKDELLELLFDEVVGEVPLPEPDPARWREQITRLWTDGHEALSRNGDIARVILGRVPMGPNAMRMSEFTLTLLRGAGIPDQAAAWAIDVVGMYVSASAIENAVTVDLAREGRDPEQYYGMVCRFFASLPPEEFPATTSLGDALGRGSREERFAFGLDVILRGLAALVPADRADRPGERP